MSGKKMTHKGFYSGCDARTPHNKKWPIEVRETKWYWISAMGTKFKKTNGNNTGDWPIHYLDLGSLTLIVESSPVI